jgi:mono/diheme cytochrome c family protein
MASVGRWIGRILLGLVGLVCVAAIGIYIMGGRYLTRTYPVREVALSLPSDSASLARGEHLARFSCNSCHGDSLTGKVMFDEPMIARTVAPNALEAIAKYTDAQLAGLIRYGVRPDGTSPIVMPPNGMYHMSDADLAAVIAYLRTQPVRTGPALPTPSYRLIGRLGMLVGEFPSAVNLIDTTVTRVGADTAAMGSRHGEYLARVICSDCHGATLTGARNGPAPSPSLSGAFGYSLSEFRTLAREGKPREPGKAIPNMADVAAHVLNHMTDEELAAMHSYLAALPASGVALR